MDLAAAFPLTFWINRAKREDRRNEMEANLAEAVLPAERFGAVEPRAGTAGMVVRGYGSPEAYAAALSLRLALREAVRRGAPAMLLIGDDTMFHPNFPALVRAVELPEDWGIFYLGCSHRERPGWAGGRVLRCAGAIQSHGVAIRGSHFRRVMQALDLSGKPGGAPLEAWDDILASLQAEIPTYACYPNLAWEGLPVTAAKSGTHASYTADGIQKDTLEAVEGLWDEVFAPGGGSPPGGRGSKLGLLFLTRGDVHHPRIWSEFVAEAPERVRVFSHAKFPEQCKGGFLADTAIRKRFITKWGDISLVRASREMLLEALQDESLTHFALLSEACVHVRPLPEILRRLELDPRSQFDFRTRKEAHPRHVSRMSAVPEVPPGCWRFTSQWWLMDRTAAIFAAGQDYTPLFERMVAPDEAYFGTVLCMQGFPLEGGVVKKDVTWTRWGKDAGSPMAWSDFPLSCLRGLLHSGALFARKSPQGADIGRFDLHRTPGLGGEAGGK
jgi:hypothetical protein